MTTSHHMFTEFRLGKFKAFDHVQKIPLKPLTLIFGPNSAGKSSIIHGLLLAHEAMLSKSSFDVHHTTLGGDSVDLGGFMRYVYQRTAENDVIWEVELDVSKVDTQLREDFLSQVDRIQIRLTIGVESGDIGAPTTEPLVKMFEVIGSGEVLLKMQRHTDGRMRMYEVGRLAFGKHFDENNEFFMRHWSVEERPGEEELAQIFQQIYQGSLTVIVGFDSLLLGEVGYRRFVVSNEYLEKTVLGIKNKGELLNAEYYVRARFMENYVRPFIRLLRKDIVKGLENLKYLGPLRSYPQRHLAFNSKHDHDNNWQAGGGYAWDWVRQDEQVRQAVNDWLGAGYMKTKYELRVRDLVGIDQLNKPLQRGLEEMPQRKQTVVESELLPDVEEVYEEGDDLEADDQLTDEVVARVDGTQQSEEQSSLEAIDAKEMAEFLTERVRTTPIERLRELILFDKRTNTEVSHRDVGVGISQTLPVLVAAYGSEEKMIAIEQPEIHLHPALQAELGDVFIESALQRKNTFLIETHSEHLILRIMRRIRETTQGRLPEGKTPIRSEDVSLLYVDPEDGASSKVLHFRLDEEGELLDPWPGGFFEEDFNERFA